MFGRSRQRSRAQAIVEFAFVAPVFFLFVFGIIEGGRVVWTYHTLNNATKEGVRFAQVRGTKSELAGAPATSESVKDYMLTKSTGLADANLGVVLDNLDGNADNKSRLKVRSTYQFTFLVQGLLGLGTVELKSSAQGIYAR